MAGIESTRAVNNLDASRYGGIAEAAPVEDKPGHPLDNVKNTKRHATLISWFEMERQKQAFNRYQQALDEDFYDNLQWAQEDAAEVMDRGQAPLVFNRIAPSVDWIAGMEKRMRVDFQVLPREKDDIEGALTKTKLLKYVSDVNRIPFLRSRAFEDSLKVGIGWMEDSIQTDPEQDPAFSDQVPWREMWWDSNARKLDLKDARYMFRAKWVDLDIAEAMFPDRKAKLRQASVAATLVSQDEDELYYMGERLDGADYGLPSMSRRAFLSDTTMVENRRDRVKLIEAWYRLPEEVQILVGGQYDRETYDPKNDGHKAAIKAGQAKIFKNTRMCVYVAMMTESHLLSHMKSPYRHDRFPYTPYWCFQRGRDGMPYGYIRRVRDIQEDLNKRASKALFLLSTNQLIGDWDAFDDWDEAREEASRPDGVLAHRKGAQIEIRRDAELATAHLELMNLDARMIQEIGGTTDDNMGRETNAKSGVAIRARQDQGLAVTARAFDNMRFAIQVEGETQLSNIEQFYTEPKVYRITGTDDHDWVEINQPMVRPDGTVEFLNDITARQADFVVDEQDLTQSIRQSMFEYLMTVLAKLPPELSIQLLDLAIEFADLPGYEKFVSRIKKINGHDELDANATPEQKAEAAQRQEAQEQQAALQQRAVMLELDEKAASIEKLKADVVKIKADAAATLKEITASAGTDGPSEVETELMQRLHDVQTEADDKIAKLENEVATLKAEMLNKANEIHAGYQAKVETAAISAKAKTDVADADRQATEAQDKAKQSVEDIKDLIKEIAKTSAEEVKALREEMKTAIAEVKKPKGEDPAAMLAKLMKELNASMKEHNKAMVKELAKVSASAKKGSGK